MNSKNIKFRKHLSPFFTLEKDEAKRKILDTLDDFDNKTKENILFELFCEVRVK